MCKKNLQTISLPQVSTIVAKYILLHIRMIYFKNFKSFDVLDLIFRYNGGTGDRKHVIVCKIRTVGANVYRTHSMSSIIKQKDYLLLSL